MAGSRRYDLLAIDLDGTLLDSRGEVCDRDVRAIERARGAGMLVTICTGRGLVECRHVTERIGQREPVVVASGAMLACPVTSRTLHRFPMDVGLVRRLAACMLEHEHAVLILKDPDEVGFDYLVVSPRGPAGLSPISRWWFERLDVRVRFAPALDQDEHPEHTVRVAVCGSRRETMACADEVRASFDEQVTIHHFGAVVPEGDPDDPDDQVVILETFDRRVNKWTAVSHLARERGIEPERIAVIGNDINDLVMLERAGLGVAVDNAIEEARGVADRMTRSNDEAGVAEAVMNILVGAW